nr:unnamed protein product [Callosobruchus analis]
MELADFPDRDLLFGLTSVESFLDLNAQDLQFGFNETKRDRILRTYVRNSYYFHLNEIFSTLKNEYTDWERPTQNPLGVRDATLSVLSDGHTAAPLIRLGYLHSIAGGKTFFLHFRHHNERKDFPQSSGSVRGEDVPYILGLPIIGGGSFYSHNYSHTDAQISKTMITYLSNFVRRGDPNTAIPYQDNFAQERSSYNIGAPYWDTYDNINQFYLEIASRPVKKDHYRGHKMSLWLNLIPQLHRPREDDDASMRHHHFLEEDEQYYDGFVRPQMKEKPDYVHILDPPPVPATITTTTQTTTSNLPLTLLPPKSDTALQATTTECPPNSTAPTFNRNADNIIRRIASGHYQSYTTALTITIAVGCFLVLLNLLIFFGIYHQRERGKKEEKRKEVFAETGSCSSSSGDTYKQSCEQQLQPFNYDRMGAPTLQSCQTYVNPTISYSHAQEEEMTQIQLQEFSSSPLSAKRIERRIHSYPDVTSTTPAPPTVAVQKVDCCSGTDDSPPGTDRGNGNPSSCVAFPMEDMNQTGILRPHGMPMTPGTVKKRVQIQEISV